MVWIGKSALGVGERYRIARETETLKQREQRLRSNHDIIRDYRRL